MKIYLRNFIQRGLMAAGGGPVILAIIYGTLGATGTVDSFTPQEVSLGILTITLMAFIAAGISVVYQMERLPLLGATAIHALTLYLDYLLIYLLNDWLAWSWREIGLFTAIYAGGYAVIWLCIVLSIRAKTASVNSALGRQENRFGRER